MHIWFPKVFPWHVVSVTTIIISIFDQKLLRGYNFFFLNLQNVKKLNHIHKIIKATIAMEILRGHMVDTNLIILVLTARRMKQTRQQKHSERGSGQVQVNGRGYTHSIVAGVALREPSCQFSTGTGMQVSLMVSWQRRDRGGPLSSSSWALLWNVSTTEGGGGGRGQGKGEGFQR